MPHIIILDEEGNEIGREPHDPGTGGRAAAGDDHDAQTVVVNLANVARIIAKRLAKQKDLFEG
jgi:hypothetical protein